MTPRVPAIVAALVALCLGASCSSKANIRYTVVRGPMPVVGGATLQGGSYSPADYRGKVVVVNFWASWCAPCRREQPGLQALSRELTGDGVRFVGVDYRDTDEAATAYVRRFGVTYPSVTDPVGELGTAFGIPYLPATVLVDRYGHMRYRLAGPQDAETIRTLVERLV